MEQPRGPEGHSGGATDEMILRQVHLLLVRGRLAEARAAVEPLLARPEPPARDAVALLEQIKRRQEQARVKRPSDGFWGELPGDLLRWGRQLLWGAGFVAVIFGAMLLLAEPEGRAGGSRLLPGLLLIAVGGALLFHLWRSRFVDDDDEREWWERLSEPGDPPWV